MEFLIQHTLLNEEKLLQTKKAVENYPHQYVGLIPFSREVTSNEPLVGVDFIPYGSCSFINVALECGWTGLHFDTEKFTYTEASKQRRDMLNSGLILSIEDALLYLESRSDIDSNIFIRPDKDLKSFSGNVTTIGEVKKFLEDALKNSSSGYELLKADTRIVLSDPVDIKTEYRWFIIDGKVISGSTYRHDGRMYKHQVTDKAKIAQAQERADGWLPDSCCVMDLADTERGPQVIEFNCINGSGFYENDVNGIFKALWEFHQ